MVALVLAACVLGATPDTLELTLDQALDAALRHSPARLEVLAARTQSVVKAAQGVAALVPTATGTLTYGRSESRSPLLPDTSFTSEGWSGSLTLSQVVFDPQVFAAVAGSFIAAGSSSTDARDKQARLGHDVIVDYLNLLRARKLRDVASSALDRAEDNLNLGRERLRLGSAAELDVLRSEVYRSQAQLEVLSAERVAATANAAFLATVGMERQIVIHPSDELEPVPDSSPADIDSLLSLVAKSNPGLALANKADAAARLNVVAAVARALPRVSANWSSDYADSLLPRSLAAWRNQAGTSWGIRFEFPLLDLKSYVLTLADAAAESRRARAAAVRARLQLRSAVTAAAFGYNESRQRLRSAEQNLELNRSLHRLAEDQHRLGALSPVDLQSVETGLAQAEASRVSALCDVYIQAADIAYLMGITGR